MEIPEGFTPSATFYKEITYNHLSFFICRWGETLNLGFNIFWDVTGTFVLVFFRGRF